MSAPMSNTSLASIRGVMILDSAGNRIMARYYDPPALPNAGRSAANNGGSRQQTQKSRKDVIDLSTLEGQRSFEARVCDQARRLPHGEIMHLPPMLVSYRPSRDLILAMVAPEHENELALWTSLSALADALNSLLQFHLEKSVIIDYYDLALLAIDEAVDGGILLEIDGAQIAARVAARHPDALGGQGSSSSSGPDGSGGSLGEQMVGTAFATARLIGRALIQ
ncbi:hypothetical protein H696_04015 [Fonticula alba]|uniref:Coatomer subunit zeta n=1 Tax=Fonticula alba TaxID=691883 RepID=A0A058Z5R3_FONAL|nr:hypothetical protein H696_04015 [Fonticula alba]KCV69595.1 hypothetical protein H696_04015 [Fonticula alba]|eukprot:XP_009496160.1 hypothetical protein H696_04015 [Fonticula alba]